MVVILSDADPLSIDRQKAALARGGRRQRLVLAALDDPAVSRGGFGQGGGDGGVLEPARGT